MEKGIQMDLTLIMSERVYTELEQRFAEAKQEYPQLTMEAFIGWAVRYYLEHAYKEESSQKGDETD